MKKSLRYLLIAAAFAFSPLSEAQTGWLPLVKAGGGGATTAWNPSDRADPTNQALSNSNLTVTQTAAGTDGIRAVSAQTTGLRYFEFVMTAITVSGSTSNNAVGIGNASAVLQFPGNDANSIGWTGSGTVFINVVAQGAGAAAWAVGDTIAIAADLGNKKMWFKNLTAGSGWNNDILANQNPAVGSQVGGLPAAGWGFAGPYLPMANGAGSGDVFTANFGATTYVGTMPTGAVNW